MKACILCSIVKPYSEYYRHSQMSDGYLGRCKECHKSEIRRNRAEKHEHYKEFDRQRAMKPHRVAARAAYMATPAGQAARARAINSYEARFPERKAATTAVSNAVRDGRLQKAPACWHCGSAKKIEGHHWDYSQQLSVVWLCNSCHRECHRLTDELQSANI